MTRQWATLALGLTLLATTEPQARHLHVEVEDGLFSIEALDVTTRAVLEEIARQSGLVVVSTDPLQQRIDATFNGVTLSTAIRRILRQQSFTLLVGAEPSNLWIYVNGDGSSPPGPGFRTADPEQQILPLSLALSDGARQARLDAVTELAIVESEDAISLVAAALGDEDAKVRAEAAYALGEIGGHDSLQLLQQALLDPDNRVREAAIEAFAEIGGEESARALAGVLNDTEASLREDAVDALGEMGGDTAIRILQQATADEREYIREAAEEYIAELSEQAP